MRRTLPGVPYPLGATADSEGVNFAIYSENARALELCLFDDDDHETRIPIRQHTAFVWHVYVPGISAGTRYAYRAYGKYEPEHGLRCNPNVLLLDPYAKATDGVERWERGCFAYDMHGGREDLKPTDHNQGGAPRAIVIDPDFDWEGDVSPAIPLHQSVIYETHVRGLTMRHPAVPTQLRGTYSGVAGRQFPRSLGRVERPLP